MFYWATLILLLFSPAANADDFACELLANPHGIFARVIEDGSARAQELFLSESARAQMQSFDRNGRKSVPKADQVAEFLRSLEGQIPRAVTAVYPAAGYDAATPFIIFPGLRRVIALDNHRFLDPRKAGEGLEMIPWRTGETPVDGYVNVFSVNQLSSMAPAILNRLAENFPGLRIREIWLIEHADRSHGRIVFDQGPGTLLREYNHVHVSDDLAAQFDSAALGAPGVEQRNFLADAVLGADYRALLFKGAMDFPATSLSRHLLRGLVRRGGFFLDGDGVAPIAASLALDPSERNVPTVSYAEISGFGYGNGSRVYVVDYSRMISKD